MSKFTFHSSRPDGWTMPRPHSDPHLRRHYYGPIRAMEDKRGFLARLLTAV